MNSQDGNDVPPDVNRNEMNADQRTVAMHKDMGNGTKSDVQGLSDGLCLGIMVKVQCL